MDNLQTDDVVSHRGRLATVIDVRASEPPYPPMVAIRYEDGTTETVGSNALLSRDHAVGSARDLSVSVDTARRLDELEARVTALEARDEPSGW